MKKKTVLVIADTFFPRKGGTEIIFLEVLKRLRRKMKIKVITSFYGISKDEKIPGIEVKRLRVKNRLFFALLSLFQGIKEVKNSGIVQTCVWIPAFPAFVLAKIFRKPCVLLVNAFFGKKWFLLRKFPVSLVYYLVEKILFSLPFDHFIALSYAQKKALVKLGIPESKISVAYPGINANLFKPQKIRRKDLLGVEEKTFIFCFFGRYDKQKGIDILLESAKIFFSKKKDAKLLIITEKEKILPEIRKLGLERKVILKDLMPQDELVKYLNASDVIVIPSKAEPFGIVAAESLALNKIVITTGVDGLKEIVGNFGIIARNSRKIAEGLEKCYELKKRQRVKVTARKEIIKRFSWDKMARVFEKVLY